VWWWGFERAGREEEGEGRRRGRRGRGEEERRRGGSSRGASPSPRLGAHQTHKRAITVITITTIITTHSRADEHHLERQKRDRGNHPRRPDKNERDAGGATHAHARVGRRGRETTRNPIIVEDSGADETPLPTKKNR
jgi:hypothetical protein